MHSLRAYWHPNPVAGMKTWTTVCSRKLYNEHMAHNQLPYSIFNLL
jgi:hypothetical protein